MRGTQGAFVLFIILCVAAGRAGAQAARPVANAAQLHTVMGALQKLPLDDLPAIDRQLHLRLCPQCNQIPTDAVVFGDILPGHRDQLFLPPTCSPGAAVPATLTETDATRLAAALWSAIASIAPPSYQHDYLADEQHRATTAVQRCRMRMAVLARLIQDMAGNAQ